MERSGGAYRRVKQTVLLVFFGFCSGVLFSHAIAGEEQKHIVFGGDAAYPPFEWLQDGKPTGFNVELAKALGEIGGANVSHRLGDWPDIVRALESGEVDVVPMFRSAERERDFAFTSAFFYVHHSIYTAAHESAVHSIEDLSGKQVAVEELSYAHEQLSHAHGDVELLLVPNTLAALKALHEGRVSYAVLAVPSTDELARRYDLAVRRIGVPLWPREYGFAIRKDRPEVVSWARGNLALAVTSGRFEEIYHEWEDRLRGQHYTLTRSLRTAALVLVPLLLSAILLVFWSWTLRRTVAFKTSALQEELARREVAEEALRHAADHDALTGLAEQSHFLKLVDGHLPEVSGDEEPPGERELIVIKLVELNRISRTFGFGLSNNFLKAFAQRIKAIPYAASGYLGRGVFAIYSDSVPTRSLFKVLAEPIIVNGVELIPNIIGGSAFFPEHGTSAAELMRHAETAISVCATRHLEWVSYDPLMEPDPVDLRLVSDFRKGGESGLFSVFQPQVDLRSGKVLGAEALVRWKHPELGLVSPARFVPLLEQTGLIARVTEWMIAEVVQAAVRLGETEKGLVLSINVASYDLVHTPLLEIIKRELQRCSCDAALIKIELTETSVAEDPERVRQALADIRKLGVKVAVDDFGTGYSSLSYLGSFPIDEVKIDREFVDGMALSPRKQSIVRSTIVLTRELGMVTVAEGAEDWATIAVLRDMKCDAVQGYVISRPVRFDELVSFLSRPGSHLSPRRG